MCLMLIMNDCHPTKKLNPDVDLDSDAPDFQAPLNEIEQVVPVRLLPPLHLWRLRLRESEGKWANAMLMCSSAFDLSLFALRPVRSESSDQAIRTFSHSR